MSGRICPFLHMTEGDIIRGENVGYGDRYIRCMQKWKKGKLKEIGFGYTRCEMSKKEALSGIVRERALVL